MKHKKKSHRRKEKVRRWQRHDDFPTLEDLDLDEPYGSRERREALGELDGDPEDDRGFDIGRWRADLVERSRNRDRMRGHELKRGALRRVREAGPDWQGEL